LIIANFTFHLTLNLSTPKILYVMKFIDEVKVFVKAGDGGRGCMSFRREKYVPRGGPDGGDGGNGGGVVFVADLSKHTLLDHAYQKHYRAKGGKHGRGKDQTGACGEDYELPVPVGTVVTDVDTGEVLGDLVEADQRLIVAAGGKGGRGNARFATSADRAPRRFEEGVPGEERTVKLTLKLMADVGLVGMPNAGKSTLISAISAARPKIADYPFTTLVPNLGVVKSGEFSSFVVADLPGLIEGAHQGKGLGHAFLKHIERTRLIIHLVDISLPDPVETYEKIRHELTSYGMGIESKPEIAAITKIDLAPDDATISHLLDTFRDKGIEVTAISAVARKGLDELIRLVSNRLK